MAHKERERIAGIKSADPEGYSAMRKEGYEKMRSCPEKLERSRECARKHQLKKYHLVLKHDPEYREKNTEKTRKWRQENPEKANATFRKIRRRRYAADVQYKLSVVLRRRFYMALKNGSKGGEAVRQLGCSIAELKKYLESLFSEGMSWENHSRRGWHIDHIKPLCSFDLTDPAQVAEACHYTNLQPLWAKENEAKGGSQGMASG